MFYSQFILAKKGPLGTIWIAAHLERKLRKNQVADTDIGVSVDSILSPDVPIALRLSSHLLLGVVRIYSRKVNYLFHDCSEALLKVKQAFRSTAVDLPPEESTAPYHSITLPETFDLDDFELPDSDNFQGNFVDHHVSTREQITLQDSMDGLVYSTSQFGLDERFGDGDTSQIGLDLDEELLFDKVAASGHTASLLDSENLNPEASVQPTTPYMEMDIDEEDITTGQNSTVVMHGAKDADNDPNAQKETVVNNPAPRGNQIQSLNFDGHGLPTELFPSTGPSTQSTQHAPYTPGLVEEVYPTNAYINEDPAHGLVNKTVLFHSREVNNNPLSELECHTPKFMDQESIKNTTSEENLHIRDTNEAGDCFSVDNKRSETDVSHIPQDSEKISVTDMNSISADVGHKVSSPTSVLAEQLKPTSPSAGILDRAPVFPDNGDRTQSLQNGDNSSGRPSALDVDPVHTQVVSATDIKENTAPTSLLKESHDMPHQSNEGVSVNPLPTDVSQTAREGILEHVSVSHMEFPGSHNLNDLTEGNRHDVSQTAREGILEHVSVSHMEFPGSHNLTDLTEGNRHDANPPLVSEPRHHFDKEESRGCSVTEVRDVQCSVGPDEMFSEPRHVLRACSSILKQPDTVVPADGNLASPAILGNQDPDRASGFLGPGQGVDFQSTSTRDTSLVSNLVSESIRSSSQEAGPSTVDGASYTVSSKDKIGNLNLTAGFDLAVPQTERVLSPPEVVPFAASTVEGASFPGVNFQPTSTRDTSVVSNVVFESIRSCSQEARPSTVDGASYTVSSKDQIGNLNSTAGFDLAVPQTERLLSPPEAVTFGASTVEGASFPGVNFQPTSTRDTSLVSNLALESIRSSSQEARPSTVDGASYTVSSKDQIGNLNLRAGFDLAVPQTERLLSPPAAVPFGASTVERASFPGVNFQPTRDTSLVSNLALESIRSSSQEARPSTVDGASYTVSSKDQIGNLNLRAGFDLAVPQTERLLSPPEAVPFGASTVDGASFPGVNVQPTSTRDTSLVSNLSLESIRSSSQEARPSTVEGASYTVSSKDRIGNLNFTAGFDLAVPQTERLFSPPEAVPFGASTVDGASYTVSSKDHQLGNLSFRAGSDLAAPQTERLFSPPEAVPFGVSSVGGAPYTVSSKDQLGNLNFRAGFDLAVPQTERFLLSPEAVPFGVSTVNGALYAANSKDQFGNLNFRAGFGTAVPQTERLLSAPEAVPFGGGYSPVQSTLEKKGPTERSVCETEFNTLAGKKRQLMETTPVEQNNNSELSWMLSKNAFGSIPDDYDVLSSILAGKRSSALKLKPTPQQPDTSRKRPRVTPRASVAKRKVLVDDTMVLHGDTIRLQLTSTEDIRRMRKKAPCTRSEIWMIQKHLLEEDIFVEPLYTGMSSELIGMHNRTYDAVTHNKASEMDVNNLLPEVPEEVQIQKNSDFSGKTSREETVEPVPVEDGGAVEEPMQKHIQIDNRNSEMGVGDMLPQVPDELLMQNNTDFSGKASREEIVESVPVEDGGAIDEPVQTNIHIDNRFSGDHLPTIEIDNQEQTRPITDSASTDLQNVQFDINVSMEIDTGSGEVVGVHPLVAATLSENRCNEMVIENESLPVDGSNGVDTVVQNGGNLDIQSIENVVTFTERSNCRADGTTNTANANEGGIPSAHDILTENGTSAQKIFESDVPKVLEQNIPADHQIDVCNGCPPHVDFVRGNSLRDDKAGVPSDASVPMENDGPLFSNISVGSEGSAHPIVAINETKEGIRSDSEQIVGENVSGIILDDTQNSPSGPMPLEDISCPPSELNLDREADESVEGENVGRQGAALEGSVDPMSSQVASLAGSIGDEPTVVDREADASVEGENVGRQGAALEGSVDPMSSQVACLAGSIVDEPTVVDNTFKSNDLGDTQYENDTEFLNFDDDDDEGAAIEEEDDNAPDAEEAGNLDTSGWSSRTRGVAKYLQTLFDAERGRGRKNLSMDNLLTGKTRKEASRMFFETLVLKTRDFVHVEQQNPFGDINIKPKGKLMKSNF